MKRTPKVYLEDILQSIVLIEEYTKAVTFNDFSKDEQIQDAVVRRLEIIGEATRQLAKEFRARYPLLPWKEMAGMRDVVIHEYFAIKLDRVWNTVKEDLPKLKKQIEKVSKELKGK